MRYGFEALAVGVSDVDRAKAFYEQLGWRLDVDTSPTPDIRIVQFTPPGSDASILIGTGYPMLEPGALRGAHLVVKDIEAARRDLQERGIDCGEVFHWEPGGLTPGPDPAHHDYGSYLRFSDPDGNEWLVQEVPSRDR
jgi:catechol 2,3-dioxygenase-like lactoylglutathione lyase family enzyme